MSPYINLRLEVDKQGFEALRGWKDARTAEAAGQLVHLGEYAEVEIGTLRGGMESGKDSIAVCFTLPDGKIVLWETSVELFLSTADAIRAWQLGNTSYAVQRFPERDD